MKNDYDISRQFQDDLIKAYNQVAYTCYSQAEAYKKAVKQPAPRYYITPKQAAQVISRMVRGDFELVNMMRPNKKRMYYSLMEKVTELSEKRAFIGKSLIYIVQFAVASPAPEFFTAPENMRCIRSYLKNGHFDDDGRMKPMKSKIEKYERAKAYRAKVRAHREMVRMRLR